MANATTLVLKNQAAVAVNYYPILVSTGKEAIYVDRTLGQLSAQSRATLTFKENQTTRRVAGLVKIPSIDAVTGLVKYTCLADFNIVTPLAATGPERLEILARVRAFIDDAIVQAAVENGETPW
jgi:hypothetical protein